MVSLVRGGWLAPAPPPSSSRPRCSMRTSPPCAAPAGDVRRKHSSRRHGRAPGPRVRPQLTGSLCRQRPAQERHRLAAAHPRPRPQIKGGAIHHRTRCMPDPPKETAHKFLVDPLFDSYRLRYRRGVGGRPTRRVAWQHNFESMHLVFAVSSPSEVMDRLLAPPWRQVGAHAPAARVPPRSRRPLSHCHARASASLSRSTRALLTALAQGRKLPRTPSSTPEPRAPPADLASDVAGGSGEVGS